jgi:hypothetical protein
MVVKNGKDIVPHQYDWLRIGKNIKVEAPMANVNMQAAMNERKSRSSILKMIQAMLANHRI